jgi:hypothetical protein
LCPICVREFTRADLEARRLTLEHVPPDSAGGKAICLTCRDCNSAGGYQVDYSIAELGKLRAMRSAMFERDGSYAGRARVSANGVDLNARLAVDENGMRITVHYGQNNPAQIDAAISHYKVLIAAGGRPSFNLTAGFRFGARTISISLLRSAYLAAFSWFGYRYALHPRLDVVRQQIRKPATPVVPPAAVGIVTRDDMSDPEPVIAAMKAPFEGLIVYLPANTVNIPAPVSVILPWLQGPEPFYAALSKRFTTTTAGRALDFSAIMLGWPIGPVFDLDFP